MKKTVNLQQVNIRQLKSVLPHFFFNRIPLYLWGRPSTGKTSAVRQFAQEEAKRRGLKYSEDKFGEKFFTMKVITLSQFDSPDLRGMPEVVETDHGKVTEFVPTAELPREGQGILFFDEMNLADDTTRAACYQIILEGRYGSLPAVKNKNGKDSYWRVAASNTENDFCSVNVTSLALLRRFSHLEVMLNVDEVVQYFMRKGHDPRVVAFMKNFAEDLFPQKWDEKLLDNKANPFPSTWENLATMIPNIQDDEMLFHLAASCVGAPVASKFVDYAKLIQTLDMKKILSDPKKEIGKLKKHGDRASLLYAVIFNIANRWHKKEKIVTGQKVIDIANELPVEFATSFVQNVANTRLNELTKVKGFDNLLTKFGRYFDI
jgi:hypothetical protein